MKEVDPFVLSITSHGRTYTATLPWNANLEDIAEAMRGLLVAASWDMERVIEYLPKTE